MFTGEKEKIHFALGEDYMMNTFIFQLYDWPMEAYIIPEVPPIRKDRKGSFSMYYSKPTIGNHYVREGPSQVNYPFYKLPVKLFCYLLLITVMLSIKKTTFDGLLFCSEPLSLNILKNCVGIGRM